MTTSYDRIRCLPLELVLDIVDSLAEPLFTDAYINSPEVQQTLLSLCLVSRAVSRVAFRHLYRRIFFTSLPQMRAFFDQSRTHRHTTSLGFSSGIPIGAIDTRHIWSLYGHSLERLNLEGQIQWFTPSSKTGPLPGTDMLEELALIPGGQRYPLEIFSTWTPFPALKRLAFMHAVLHDHSDNGLLYSRLPELFPQLETLVMTLPARSKKQLASFAHLLSCLPNLKTAIIIEPCLSGMRRRGDSNTSPLSSPPSSPRLPTTPMSPGFSSHAHNANEPLEETIGKRLLQRGVRVIEVDAGPSCAGVGGAEQKKAFKPWFSDLVREGKIWTLEGRVWGTREPEAQIAAGLRYKELELVLPLSPRR